MFTGRVLALTAVFCLSAACGGGGGSSRIANDGGPPLATITSANATTVAGAVSQQVLDGSVIGGLSTPRLPFASSNPAVASTLLFIAAPTITSVGAAQSPIQPCAVSGTVDITVSVASALTLSPGDEFSFQFAQCDDGFGSVLDGGMVLTVSEFDGDVNSGAYRLGMTMMLSAFQIVEGTTTASTTGDVSFSIDTTVPTVTRITLSTASLSTTINGVTEAVADLSIVIVEDSSTLPESVTVDTTFRLSSPQLDGDIIVTTSAALERSGSGLPFSGEILIRGANNASITIIALDATMVRLEIDTNGDGAPDEIVDTTWAELLAA